MQFTRTVRETRTLMSRTLHVVGVHVEYNVCVFFYNNKHFIAIRLCARSTKRNEGALHLDQSSFVVVVVVRAFHLHMARVSAHADRQYMLWHSSSSSSDCNSRRSSGQQILSEICMSGHPCARLGRSHYVNNRDILNYIIAPNATRCAHKRARESIFMYPVPHGSPYQQAQDAASPACLVCVYISVLLGECVRSHYNHKLARASTRARGSCCAY